MDTDGLEQLGLSDKEARIYQACLELGQAKAADLTEYTGINRGTIYDIAKSLFHKGLMGTTQKGRTTYFLPHSPERFVNNMDSQLKKARELLPEIESIIRTTHHRPKMRFYEGKEGLRAIYDETLQCQSKKLLQFVSVKDMLESVGKDFMQEYIEKRARRHIQLRAINSPEGEIEDKTVVYSSHTDPKYLRETRLAPVSISFPSMVMVCDDSLFLMSTKKENFGFIIDSKEFSDMMRCFFDVLWNISKPI